MKKCIELSIGEVILQGFPNINNNKFESSLKEHLKSNLPGLETSNRYQYSRDIEYISAGSIDATANKTSAQLGSQISESICEGLGR